MTKIVSLMIASITLSAPLALADGDPQPTTSSVLGQTSDSECTSQSGKSVKPVEGGAGYTFDKDGNVVLKSSGAG